jgi:hypothetical protein
VDPFIPLRKKKTMNTEFNYKNPSETFDGTPYEAAEQTVIQVEKILDLLSRGLADIQTQGLNAHMQRNLDNDLPPDAATYSALPEYEVLEQMKDDVLDLERRLALIRKAVSFDPFEE